MNILVLTSIYRDILDLPSVATTPVVHNFAKEWVKEGNNVLLIHNFNIFPILAYAVPKKIISRIASRRGFNAELQWKQRRDTSYERDGVKVYRSTLLKIVPQGSYTDTELKKSLNKILKILKKEHFTPDVIVAHLENPQLFQLAKLKNRFPSAKTCFVFHNVSCLGKKGFEGWEEKYLSKIDKIGFRCMYAQREAVEKIGFNREYFLCPSGIDNNFIKTVPDFEQKFSCGPIKIMYAGQLIPRKHVDKLILAVKTLIEHDEKVTLDIIGDGADQKELEKLTKVYNIEQYVSFKGRLPHENVLELMRQADIFVMISTREVFGLVYLEAMSQGCVAIASNVGGMEGIIIDGINGFMCEAGDQEALTGKLLHLIDLPKPELRKIARAGFNTAREYSETMVAKKYLENVVRQ